MPGPLSFLPDQEQQGLPGLPDDQASELTEVFRAASTMNPVDAAKTVSTALKLDANPAAVSNDPAGALAALGEPTPEYWDWLKANRPATARYLSDPSRMAATRDIMDELAQHEDFFRQWKQSTRPNLLQSFGQAFAAGAEQINQMALNIERLTLQLFDAPLSALFPAEGYDVTRQTGVGRFLTANLEQSEQIEQSYNAKQAGTNPLQRYVLYEGVKGATAMFPQIGAAILTGGGSAAANFTTPGFLESVKQTAVRMAPFAAKSFGSYAREAEKEGRSLPEQLAYAGLATLAEVASEAPIFESYISLLSNAGGVKTAVNGATSLMKRFGQRAAQWALTTLNEGLQEAYVDPLTASAKKIIYQPDMPVFGEGGLIDPAQMGQDFIGGISMSLVFSAAGMTGTVSQALAEKIVEKGAPPTTQEIRQLQEQMAKDTGAGGKSIFQNAQQVGQAQADAQAYRMAGQAAAASEHLNRFPEGFREHTAMNTAGGLETVYVEPGPFIQLMQDAAVAQGLQVEEAIRLAANELGVSQEQIAESQATGAAIPINYALWLEKTAKTPAYAQMEQYVKFDPDGLTLSQAALEEERIKGLVEQEQARAKERIAENEQHQAGYDTVYNDITSKLLAAGRPEKISKRIWGSYVDRSARLWAAHAVTEAARRGITVEEWYAGANAPQVMGAEGAQVQPSAAETEIEARTFEDAGKRSTKAFQYLHPELKEHIQAEAALIEGELGEVVKGEKGHYTDQETGETVNWGTHKLVSQTIQRIQDATGASYAEIGKALDAIQKDQGAENYALAKKIELIIDDNLSKGVERSGSWGRADQPANQAYIDAKKGLGAQTLEQAAWHTSLADFNEFDTAYVHTGIGQTLKGWGINFTSSEELKNHYKELMEQNRGKKGIDYLSEIPDDADLLNWDVTLGEQPNKVQRAIEGIIKAHPELEALGNASGKDFYFALAEALGGTKEASLALRDAGVPGHSYTLDAHEYGNVKNFVVYDNPAMEVRQKFYQGKQSPRGMVSIGAQQSVISLLQKADASTFLHESAHVWLSDAFEFVKAGQANEAYAKDWATLAEWLKVEEGQESLTTDQQEQFARGFEAYLLEGKAPSKGLAKAFQAFRRWLVRIYQSAANLDVDITPQVRGVMDRMIATEEEIREAEISSGQNEDVITEADVTPEVWSKLDELKTQARELAFTTLMKQQMEELKKDRQEFLKTEQEKIAETVRKQMKDEPLYGSIDEMQRYLGGDPKVLAELYRKGDVLGEDVAGTIDGIAEGHGYGSADELAQEILNSRTFDEELAARVAQDMEEHAGLLNPRNLKDAAMEAIRNDKREEFLALEESILRDMVEQTEQAQGANRRAALERARVSIRAARKQAQQIMEGKKYIDAMTPTVYFAAERDAAVAAAKAAQKGDKAKALQYATQKLVNHALALEAMKNRAEVEKIWRYIGRYQKRGRNLLNMPPEFIRQIDSLLERFGLGPGPVIEPGDRVESLREFADRMKDEYHDLPLSDKMLSEAFRKPQLDLTLGELRELYSAFKVLGTLGAKYSRFLNDFLKVEIKQAGGEIRTSVEENVGTPREGEKGIGSKTRLQKLLNLPDEITAWLVKPEFLARFLDGNQDGPVQKYFTKLFNKAWEAEKVMETQVIQGLRDLVGKFYTQKEMARMSKDKVFIKAINKNLTKEETLLVALNWGNDGNRQRLMDGYGLGVSEVWSILDTLTEKDWHLVQGVWDYLETFWPQIKALEEDVVGVTPEKVERAPVQTKYGTFEGGYFPIAYDPEKSSTAAKNDEQLNALYKEMPAARAMTRHGHTKERAAQVNRPISLKWSTLTNHLVNVTHDLTHRKTIIDVNRLLKDPNTRTAIENAVGVKGYRALENAVKAIASDQSESIDFADRTFRFLRSRSTLYAMGLNLRVALLQTSGVFQSAWEIGAVPTMRGLARFAVNPGQTWNMVKEKSVFMHDRAQVMDRDIYDFSRRMFKGDNGLTNFAYSIMGFMDQMWCVPAWAESYRMALAEGMTEEAAIEKADGAIRRAAGSGAVKDLSAAQRGTEIKKALTMFYSYGNLLYNRYWLATKSAAADVRMRGDALGASKKIAGLVAYGWILPGVFEFALREAMRQKDDGEDPEEFWKRAAAALASGPLQTIPIVRDVGAYVINSIFGQYADFRVTPLESSVSDLTRTVKRGIAAAKGEGEWEDAVESAAKSGAYLGGIPQQVVNWVFNAFDWFAENGEASWRDLFSRKVKE